MALSYYPSPGEILLCDYGSGFIVPEMVKRRPVVVVSPRLRKRADLVAVVPLSTTPPNPVELHHCSITLAVPLPKPFEEPQMWAKCDMVATVSFERLNKPYVKTRQGRSYRELVLEAADMAAIETCLRAYLGL